jgi:hypothetical protein
MAKQKKNPWVAAILNLLIFGLGYVYVGKRIGFGIGLIFVDVILGSMFLFFETHPAVWIYIFILGLLFAYDGYKTAGEVNRTK